MKYQFAFALIAALCFLGARANEETSESTPAEGAEQKVSTLEVKDKICEPGELTEVACNTCICNNEGTELACTKKICIGIMKEGEEKPQNPPATEGEGEVKPQLLPVPDADLDKVPTVAKDRRRREAAEGSCVPGENFQKECNTCECPASGRRSEAQICTIIAC